MSTLTWAHGHIPGGQWYLIFRLGYRRPLSTSLGGSAVASQGFYRNGGDNSKGKYPQCPAIWMSSAGRCGPWGVTQWFLSTVFSLRNSGDHSSRETSAYKDGRCGPVSHGEIRKDIAVASRPWRTRSISLMDSWSILQEGVYTFQKSEHVSVSRTESGPVFSSTWYCVTSGLCLEGISRSWYRVQRMEGSTHKFQNIRGFYSKIASTE